MKVLTAQQMHEADRQTIERGTPADALMERAARRGGITGVRTGTRRSAGTVRLRGRGRGDTAGWTAKSA